MKYVFGPSNMPGFVCTYILNFFPSVTRHVGRHFERA